jgi:predicted Zn-dependent protease
MKSNIVKMDISKMSDEELADAFTEAFEEQVASYNNISQFEVEFVRETRDKSVTAEVSIYGMAGSPTLDNFKQAKVKNASIVTMKKEGRGTLKMRLVPAATITLNTNDYLVVYKPESTTP